MKQPTFLVPAQASFPLGAGPDAPVLVVQACDVGQLGLIMAILAPVLHELVALPPDLVQRVLSEDGPEMADVLVLLQLLSAHNDLAFDFVAVAAKLEPAAVKALMPDVFAYTFAVCVQLNADFFVRALPAFKAAGELISASGLAGKEATSSTPGPPPSTS